MDTAIAPTGAVRQLERGCLQIGNRHHSICQRLGGGGHVKAAGCQVCGTADEVRNILLDAVQKEWSNA